MKTFEKMAHQFEQVKTVAYPEDILKPGVATPELLLTQLLKETPQEDPRLKPWRQGINPFLSLTTNTFEEILKYNTHYDYYHFELPQFLQMCYILEAVAYKYDPKIRVPLILKGEFQIMLAPVGDWYDFLGVVK